MRKTGTRSARPFKPIWVSRPGDTLADLVEESLVEERVIHKCLRCFIINHALPWTPEELRKVIAGRLRITSERALDLERSGLGSAAFWQARQAQYDAGLIRLRRNRRAKSRSRVKSKRTTKP